MGSELQSLELNQFICVHSSVRQTESESFHKLDSTSLSVQGCFVWFALISVASISRRYLILAVFIFSLFTAYLKFLY